MGKQKWHEKLTDEEAELFRTAMKDVQRLGQAAHHHFGSNKSKTKTKPKHQPKIKTEMPISWQDWSQGQWVGAEDKIEFFRPGLQYKKIQILKRGRFILEASLDLHRMTVEEALAAIDHFFHCCQHKNKRYVCLIHGKGHFSPMGKPILKNVLNQWLRHHAAVLAFYSATPKRGGGGALHVLLSLNIN